ncbi:hypothetical protein IEQ34_022431 [Dendrobium chrysotoxum]|uniref:WIYLD domain-containing protein n=1 Tax=Dendrobium chrysotoxum TaxID=161865 RepID=A0AAV7FX77_DENCH|nr:hypothetical protein IEQ34_022431 [Dendrobium chrysotoxum]
MASRGTRKGGTHRMDGAIAALTPLGFSKKLIRDTIKELLQVYGDNDAGWYFVEENYYKLAIDKIIEDQDSKKEEKMEDEGKASEEGRTTEASGQALLQLEAGSSSNRGFSSIVESSTERAVRKLEECCDMVPGIELSQLNPSVPKRRPCYGWISEDED